MHGFTPFLNWQVADKIAAIIRRTRKSYIGYEVLETLPSGKEQLGVIVSMQWDDTVYTKDGQLGDWCVLVRVIATGWQSWTGASVLTLTGRVYESPDEAVAKHVLCVGDE